MVDKQHTQKKTLTSSDLHRIISKVKTSNDHIISHIAIVVVDCTRNQNGDLADTLSATVKSGDLFFWTSYKSFVKKGCLPHVVHFGWLSMCRPSFAVNKYKTTSTDACWAAPPVDLLNPLIVAAMFLGGSKTWANIVNRTGLCRFCEWDSLA